MTEDEIKEEITQFAALLAALLSPAVVAEWLEALALDVADINADAPC